MFFLHEKTINDKKDSSFINLTWNNFSLFRYGSAETLEEIHKRGGWHERGDQRSRSQTESRVSRFFTGNRFDFGAILRRRRRVFVDVLERHSTIRLLHPFDSIFPIFRFRVKNVIKKKKKKKNTREEKKKKEKDEEIVYFYFNDDTIIDFFSPLPPCVLSILCRVIPRNNMILGRITLTRCIVSHRCIRSITPSMILYRI